MPLNTPAAPGQYTAASDHCEELQLQRAALRQCGGESWGSSSLEGSPRGGQAGGGAAWSGGGRAGAAGGLCGAEGGRCLTLCVGRSERGGERGAKEVQGAATGGGGGGFVGEGEGCLGEETTREATQLRAGFRGGGALPGALRGAVRIRVTGGVRCGGPAKTRRGGGEGLETWGAVLPRTICARCRRRCTERGRERMGGKGRGKACREASFAGNRQAS